MKSLANYASLVEADLVRFLNQQPQTPLSPLVEYSLGLGNHQAGKRIRPALCLLFAEGWGGDTKQLRSTALGIELFHNSTLVHDDIVDRDTLRRGQPSLWQQYGEDFALNTGDYLYHLAFQAILAGTDELVQQRCLQAFMRVIEGQDADFRQSKAPLEAVTVSQYWQMVQKKTGVLLGIACFAGTFHTTKDTQLAETAQRFGEKLGVTYQLYDDYVSIWGKPADTGKVAYGDLYEKKKTLIVLQAHQTCPALAQYFTPDYKPDESSVSEVLDLLTQAGAEAAARLTIGKERTATIKLLDAMQLTTESKQTLRELIDRLIKPEVIDP